MNGIELVKQYFPDADDEYCEYILWNKTGFPSFFIGDPVEHFGNQLERFRVALNIGMDVCESCGKITDNKDLICVSCKSGISGIRGILK